MRSHHEFRAAFTRRLITAALWVLPACQPAIATSYEPRTALQPAEPSAYRAARFYDDDLRLILGAKGRRIGELDARGRYVGPSQADVDEQALIDAAAQGGTHVILTRKDLEGVYLQLQSAQTDTTCSSTTQQIGSVSSSAINCTTANIDAILAKVGDLPSAHYWVYYVPCENWHLLPDQLRPKSYQGCDRAAASNEGKPSREVDGQLPAVPASVTPPLARKDAEAGARTDWTDASCLSDPLGSTRLPFDRASAGRAIREGEEKSLHCDWREKNGITVALTFASRGCLKSIHVDGVADKPTFAKCLLDSFALAHVDAFQGDDVTVSKHLGPR